MSVPKFSTSSSLTQISHQNLDYARHVKAVKETGCSIDMRKPKTFHLKKNLLGPNYSTVEK